MATNLRGLCRLNISLANNAFFKYNFINVGVRCMYTERDLGVSSYENTRYVFRNQFMTIENTFREKMQEICQDQNGVVYTEDLKAMIHLAQANESDMQLLNNMLEKYIQKQEEKKFGKYIFGPVVMRMYYHLNQPEYALEAFDNNALKESFDYRTSFRILMCLLYKNNMYKEMREVYQKVLDKNGMDYIRSCNVLMYAGCLKENTPEALEYALGHWKQQYDKMKPSIRSCSLLSCLAIKNNKPEIALDILSTISLDRIMSVRSLKMLAYLHLGRYIQIIPILKRGLEEDNVRVKSHYFFADVMYELEEKLKAENVEESKQLLNLIEQARKHDFIQTNYTLEEFILRPVIFTNRDRGASENTDDKRRFRNRQQYQSQEKTELKNYF
ncbi:pentatricopeptide repeat-containing protein 2, mitochondrial-like [Bombus vosnesenskii]|uniref:Pentatricopeptide repeat-containing protein 2, mitochondrial-like n=1 Tax=Bombus vosnesenskii TaxID=207650 RepID=A0A6J3LLX9_9HYME|nr:pentatricopeptide repeat-containing protein 2, mitochondrial-like [Bombus vosnesenskii]